jgi:diguanylate cyclase (GGDEF)-like protein/PAS domain S-box-containing protein
MGLGFDDMLRRLADLARDALVVLARGSSPDAPWLVVHANAALERLTGAAPGELIGTAPRFLADPASAEPLPGRLIDALSGDRPASLPVSVRAGDGALRPAMLTLAPFAAPDGQPHFWAGAILALDGEPSQLERYALAAEGANDGLWDWDLATGHVCYSPRWIQMLGASEGEIGDSPEEWLGRVHEDDIDALRLAIDALVEGTSGELEHEQRVRLSDGSYRWMLTRGVAKRGADGRAVRIAGSQTDISDRHWAREQLAYDAFHDGLTGLPNRALFLDRLGQALLMGRRRNEDCCAVLALDIDRFKLINDSMGHGAGDEFLTVLARRLEGSLKEGDTLARLAGDEFAILAERVGDVNRAMMIAERVQSVLALPILLDDQEIFASCCVGIAIAPMRGRSAEDLMRDANLALYRAKSRGTGRIEVFDQALHASAVSRLKLETDLRRAIDRDELEVFYQPVVELETRRIVGMEALVRWLKAERGPVSPAEFIPMAEETGLILPVGNKVMTEACAQLADWRKRGLVGDALAVNVNISAKQIAQTDLVGEIRDILKKTGLNGSQLKVELTESVIMENPELAAAILVQVRGMGVGLGVDDFGTGYSSLSYLHRFPITTLKIDRSFIARVDSQAPELALITTIIKLGQSLGLEIVAEGIETEEQRRQLIKLGCRLGQGYLFAPPMPAQKIETMLAGQINEAIDHPPAAPTPNAGAAGRAHAPRKAAAGD